MAKLPIMQANDLLEIEEIVAAKLEGEDRQFLPRWADEGAAALTVDVGLLALVPSPLNASRTLAVCNSLRGRGVYGAFRAVLALNGTMATSGASRRTPATPSRARACWRSRS